jgi:hypothetical protein
MAIKEVIKKLLGDTIMGWLDFLRHPSMEASWGGPFNGQKYRQRILFDLLYCFPIKAIVETGTYRGTTTALFAATALPVYTTEIHPRYFSYSRLHFLFNRDVIHLYQKDSRSFLRALSEDRSVPKEDVLFYLDAHWGEDLPLREELEIIFLNWKRPVVMIDDFAVPDSNYGFDSYGPEKTLNLKYIDSIVSAHKLSVFFPAANPLEETGSKRGSVVLCLETSGAEIDKKIKTLVRNSPHQQG